MWYIWIHNTYIYLYSEYTTCQAKAFCHFNLPSGVFWLTCPSPLAWFNFSKVYPSSFSPVGINLLFFWAICGCLAAVHGLTQEVFFQFFLRLFPACLFVPFYAYYWSSFEILHPRRRKSISTELIFCFSPLVISQILQPYLRIHNMYVNMYSPA